MQVWAERYVFKRKVVFSAPMKCLRIRAQIAKPDHKAAAQILQQQAGQNIHI